MSRAKSGDRLTTFKISVATQSLQFYMTNRGIQPVVRVAWKRKSFWLYGVVEP
ncbi:hypothetical protein [Nostoc sp.]|uniref:hypothetical protein n=1 Tax=Nostoc sp. TaxID=1180 RepID=UPI002FF606EE